MGPRLYDAILAGSVMLTELLVEEDAMGMKKQTIARLRSEKREDISEKAEGVAVLVFIYCVPGNWVRNLTCSLPFPKE